MRITGAFLRLGCTNFKADPTVETLRSNLLRGRGYELLISHSSFSGRHFIEHLRRTQTLSMEIFRSLSAKLAPHRELLVHGLLLTSLVALGFRSAEQQKEIEALEAEKAALRASNAADSAAMWSWRQELFRLAESDSPVISASRLRAIYGEEEPAPAAASSRPVDTTGSASNIATEPVPIS